MRPVTKGDGAGKHYAHYRDALDDLADEIGLFCSYCEMPIKNAPEVEHVQPKSLSPALGLVWSNFLLGCKICNSVKSGKPVSLGDVAFPDSDNTFRGFVYHHEKTEVSAHLEPAEAAAVTETLNLVKLHRHPEGATADDRPSARDRRYKRRGEAWEKAKRVKTMYRDSGYREDIRDLIANELAPETGFFSVWMTIFRDRPEVLTRLIVAFPGTSVNCFDPNGSPLPRPGGKL